jgi:hypothetical protein
MGFSDPEHRTGGPTGSDRPGSFAAFRTSNTVRAQSLRSVAEHTSLREGRPLLNHHRLKAGWLVKEKGTWFLTEEGKSALASYPDPEVFETEARRLYKAWKKDQPVDDTDESDDVIEPVTTLEEAEEAAWGDIRTYLGSMPPYDFQELVAALLRAMGYRVDWVAPPGPTVVSTSWRTRTPWGQPDRG